MTGNQVSSGRVLILGQDVNGNPVAVLVDALGHLQVEVLTSPSGTGAYNTPTNGAVNVAIITTQILAANPNRLYALIVNDSAVVIYLALGAAAVVNSGIRLNANGGSYEMSPKLGNLYLGAINGIHAGVGAQVVGVVEGV